VRGHASPPDALHVGVKVVGDVAYVGASVSSVDVGTTRQMADGPLPPKYVSPPPMQSTHPDLLLMVQISRIPVLGMLHLCKKAWEGCR
jgi:hypothetical protein